MPPRLDVDLGISAFGDSLSLLCIALEPYTRFFFSLLVSSIRIALSRVSRTAVPQSSLLGDFEPSPTSIVTPQACFRYWRVKSGVWRPGSRYILTYYTLGGFHFGCLVPSICSSIPLLRPLVVASSVPASKVQGVAGSISDGRSVMLHKYPSTHTNTYPIC